MEDVLAVYERPYDDAEPVLCLDEKPVSLHAEVAYAIEEKTGKAAVEGKAARFGSLPDPAGELRSRGAEG